MKRFFFLVWSVITLLPVSALTIPKGTLYFNNSKTSYSQVQFVFGKETDAESYVYTMKRVNDTVWSVAIPSAVSNMYRYTFSATSLPTGLHSQSFVSLKDSISNQLNLYRTSTSDVQMYDSQIYVPSSSDNWTAGAWRDFQEYDPAVYDGTTPTGTLPIVYIETTNRQEITSKEEYITGTIQFKDSTGYLLGTGTTALTIEIKGRGNYTWTGFSKKPYKIKLGAKQSLFGMPKSKHWALMAGADDNLGFLRNTMGYELSKLIGLKWTPSQQPVELVLNGQYMGLYFLTETVRVEKNRVNIAELEDNCTNADSVSGGWIVEIDNYSSAGNVEFDEGNGQHVMVSMKSPEVLSQTERTYITNQLNTLNTAIYNSTSTQMEQLLNIEEAAKYYVVQEIMEDCESYHGSCYLYKDRETNDQAQQWFFGPVWDFGNAYNRMAERFIYDGPIWPQYWIGQIASFPVFQSAVRDVWAHFYYEQYANAVAYVDEFADEISIAVKQDAARWQSCSEVQTTTNMAQKAATFKSDLSWRVNWLQSQWQAAKPTDINSVEDDDQQIIVLQKTIQNGELRIVRDGKTYDLLGHRVR